MKNPFFSILVPVYNVEKYLQRCLDSLMAQTFKDIEIICVNDGSTDGSAEILEKNRCRDSRIVVITLKENRGLVFARKTAIQASSGKYIIIVDSDDELKPFACKVLWKELKKDPTDILMYGTEVITQVNFDETAVLPYTGRLTGSHVFRGCFMEGKYFTSLWNKTYSSELCKKIVPLISDEKITYSEDVYLYWLLSDHASSFRGIKDKLLVYYYGSGISGNHKLDLARFKVLCTNGVVFKVLTSYIESGNVPEPDKADYSKALMCRMGNIIIQSFNDLMQLPVSEQPEAFQAMVEAWSLPMVLGVFPRLWYEPDSFIHKKEIVGSVCNVKLRPVKTVGLYYFRIYNGGVEHVLALLAKILMDKGYNVVLFTSEKPDPRDFPLPEGVRRVIVPMPADKFNLEDCKNRNVNWRKALEENPVDVMIYSAYVDQMLLSDMLMIQHLGVPVIIYTHGICGLFYSTMLPFAKSMPSIYSMATAVASLTRTDKEYWSSFNRHTYLVRNPIDNSIFDIKPVKHDKLRIVWVGRLSGEKNPMVPLQVMTEVHQKFPDAVMSIVGKSEDGSFEASMNSYIAENGLKDVVTMEGYSTDCGKFYSSSDIYLATSTAEGFMLTLLESKAAGLPCVAFDIPYLELARIEDGGLITVPQNDVLGMAQEVCKLLEDEEYRKEMGKKARRSGEEFIAADIGDCWKQILDDISSQENYASSAAEDKVEERLMIETQLHFLGTPTGSQSDYVVQLLRALPKPIRNAMPKIVKKFCSGLIIIHNEGWRRFFKVLFTKIFHRR